MQGIDQRFAKARQSYLIKDLLGRATGVALLAIGGWLLPEVAKTGSLPEGPALLATLAALVALLYGLLLLFGLDLWNLPLIKGTLGRAPMTAAEIAALEQLVATYPDAERILTRFIDLVEQPLRYHRKPLQRQLLRAIMPT